MYHVIKMSTELVVKNTLAFRFPGDAAQPAVADMVSFIKALKGDQSLMETAYKISDEKAVFIRFKCESAMQFVLANNDEVVPFHYCNGDKVMVRMSVAGNTRYVRVFDLPPEVPDADLASVMEKYGKVKRTVRERFPAEFKLEMYTGVRGVYMDIEKEIPDILFFRNRKGRIFYDGIKPKCFTCKSDTHLKKCCPVLRERQAEKKQKQMAPENLEKAEEDISTVAAENTIDETSPASLKKVETKRQRSLDTDRDSYSTTKQTNKRRNKTKPASSESDDSSLATVSDASPTKSRHRILTYHWIEDEQERKSLMEEDKQRIAVATNTPVDEIIFYYE